MPLFLVRHTLKKKGLPLLNLVGAKTISDKLSDISADNQSISYRYRFIDDHSAVQGITTNSTGSESSLLFNPIYAYIDSLVPYMWLPLDTCIAFGKAFNLTWNSTLQLYLVDDSLHQ